jgi:5-dehydro-2-deoxygluconokinase
VRAVGGECRTSLAVYESTIENFQNVIYRNDAADFQVTVDDMEAVDYAAYGAVITAGTVFAAEPSRSATFRAFELARAAGLPIIFDIDYRPYSWPSPQVAEEVLSRAGAQSDMIVGNDEEFGFMAGAMDKGLAKARALAGEGRLIVYKMGEKGAITVADGAETRTGIYPVTASSPTAPATPSWPACFPGSPRAMDPSARPCCAARPARRSPSSRPGCAPAMPDEAGLAEFLAGHPGPTA